MHTKEDYDDLVSKVVKVVEEFIAGEEEYGDDAYLKVTMPTLELSIVDEDDIDESVSADFYPILDLLAVDIDEPGRWIVDDEAVEDVVRQYIFIH